jgi:tRNA G18 (ribose-2'-O)-methylase SpoU
MVAQRWSRLHGASPRAGLWWVVLETVRSEGNLGSLIRTSEATGGAGFILVGVADSLNLAVAGSLLLNEVYRARSVRRARSP